MAYIPTEWFNGDTITAEKLNKVEEGIEEIGGAISNGGSGIGSDRCIFVNSSQDGEVYGEWKTVTDALMEGLAPEASLSTEDVGIFGYDKEDKRFLWGGKKFLEDLLIPHISTSMLQILATNLTLQLSTCDLQFLATSLVPQLSTSDLETLAASLSPYITSSNSE